MLGWLCMVPVNLEIAGLMVGKPEGVIATLSIYKTKAAARKVHGPNAELVQVRVTNPNKRIKP